MKPSSLSKVTKTSTKLAASVKSKLIYLLSFINEKQYVDTDSYIGRDKRDLHSSVLRQKNCKNFQRPAASKVKIQRVRHHQDSEVVTHIDLNL